MNISVLILIENLVIFLRTILRGVARYYYMQHHSILKMKKTFLILLFSFSQIVYAQYPLDVETFRALSTTEQRLDFMIADNVNKMDKLTFDALLPIIEEEKDDKAIFYWHFQNCQFGIRFNNSPDDCEKSLVIMKTIAEKKGYKVELVVTQFKAILTYYGNRRKFEQELYSDYLNCFEQMKMLGIENFKMYVPEWTLYEIGRNFYEMGDTEKSLECLLEAEKITSTTSHFYTLSLNIIETIYAYRKDYPQALIYAQKIYEAHYKLNLNDNSEKWLHNYWQGLASLNIADYLFEMGKIEECEAYADRGYQLSKIKENFNRPDIVMAEFEALQVLIKIKLRLGRLEEVVPFFKRAQVLKQHIGEQMDGYYFKPMYLYKNYVTYYEAKKDYSNAYKYIKLVNNLQDSLNRRNDKRKLWQTEMRVKVDRYQSQIQSAEADSLLQQQLRNIAVLAWLFFTLAAFVIYHRIKKDNKIIQKQKVLLEESLGEKETLLKEIHHRVKNNLQIISGLFEKQARKVTDETTKKLMREGKDRVFSIALVHQNLYHTDNLSTIEIKSYLELLAKNIEKSQANEQQNISIDLDFDHAVIDIDTAIPLGLILNELITNCFKYAFIDRYSGKIKVIFKKKDRTAYLTIEDDGIGLPPDFDQRAKQSLGMNLVQGLVRQLNGEFSFQTGHEGTVFKICFVHSKELS